VTFPASFPVTRREALVEVLHGVEVADPYRWLEAEDAAEVADWVQAQNQLTRSTLDARGDRAVWHRQVIELMSGAVVLAAATTAGVLVTLERAPRAQQAELVIRPVDDLGAAPRTLVDPTRAGADTTAAVDWFHLSPDGAYVAYGVSEGGTEHSLLRVVCTADGRHLAEEIPHTRACDLSWEADGAGFVYTRYAHGDQYHRTVYAHRLGAQWRQDPVIWSPVPTPQTWAGVSVSPDGRWVLVTAMVGWSRDDLHLLDRRTGRWHTLIEGAEARHQLVFGPGGHLYGTTTLDAPNGRLVRIRLDSPDAIHGGAAGPEHWQTLVAERSEVLGSVAVAGESLVVSVTRRATDFIERRDTEGRLLEVLDGLGLVSVDGLTADRTTGRTFVVVSGFQSPGAVWEVTASGADQAASVLERRLPFADDVLPGAALTVEEVQYRSGDGTPIGMFILRRADLDPAATTPAILTGYGGFAISLTPAWSPLAAAWCLAGGIYAVAGVRGGLEHGEAWHRAGKRQHKQNVFEDFIAAADFLVDSGRTGRERLAIAGGSNGGLLVGAALTRRPDLCRAVWCAVPLLDMIRFPQFLIAKLWTEEYGDPEIAEEFAWLHAYSPYHQVRQGVCYPAVLLTTAQGDTRVDPLHARKMAAALQWATSCGQDHPVLLHQEGRAGHGVGKPVGKRAAEQADVLSFFAWQLGADDPGRGIRPRLD
jgi:prolyl oligopeptidase